MNYKGVIIKESLEDRSVLGTCKILETKAEQVTERHKTPWLKRWTLHTVEIPEEKADEIAEIISKSFDKDHPDWYADYKNDKYHYIVFKDKIFKVNKDKPKGYKAVTNYGISIGIPEYQLGFAPDIG